MIQKTLAGIVSNPSQMWLLVPIVMAIISEGVNLQAFQRRDCLSLGVPAPALGTSLIDWNQRKKNIPFLAVSIVLIVRKWGKRINRKNTAQVIKNNSKIQEVNLHLGSISRRKSVLISQLARRGGYAGRERDENRTSASTGQCTQDSVLRNPRRNAENQSDSQTDSHPNTKALFTLGIIRMPFISIRHRDETAKFWNYKQSNLQFLDNISSWGGIIRDSFILTHYVYTF